MRTIIVIATVAASGCMLGGGPTLALRLNGDGARVGFDADDIFAAGKSSALVGAGGGIATGLGSGSTPTSTHWNVEGSALDTNGAFARLDVGVTTPLGDPGGFASVSGGGLAGFSGFAASLELGLRWDRGPEVFLSARANLVVTKSSLQLME
jgi:hypothetical protein